MHNVCLSVFKLQEQHDAIKFLLYKHDASNFRQKQKTHELPNQKTTLQLDNYEILSIETVLHI